MPRSKFAPARALEPERFSTSIGRLSLEAYATQLGAQALGVASGIVIARCLGPAGKGLWAWILLWPALVVAGGKLGLDAAATYYGRTEPGSRAGMRALLAPVAGTAGVVLALGFAAVAAASRGQHDLYRPGLIAVALAAGPLALYAALVQGFLLGAARVRTCNALALVAPLLQAGSLVATAVLRPEALTVRLAVGSWSASYAVAALAAHLAARHVEPLAVFDRGLTRRALGYGWRVHLGGLAAHLNQRILHFFIGACAGAASLGLFSVALSGAEVLAYLVVAESLVLFPAASPLPAADRWRFVRQRATVALGWFGAAAAVSVVVAGPVVRLLFGTPFQPAVPIFYWLLPGMALHGLNLLLGTGLRAAGDPLAPTRASWLALAVCLLVAPLLVPRWGMRGAAVAFWLVQLVSCVNLLVVARRSNRGARPAAIVPCRAPEEPGDDTLATLGARGRGR